ncbi:16S rRNA (guanine(966)-N(2))-methyltransferase RsmD [Atopobium sp. oral taxon 810]|uniref:16S rRNA (guanine(966)-N(2))-methyltransferase RsmD n=1 Tax=Atopobium sp. oral taxon 810 TaxID=712158 RepID=UPI000396AD14|nr:16S rRNA (guanine(966)-N(2))-methyltransferase RsmD [Atopobium sp. oral taxon 810]ERI04050.1 RNA methyltransferase, RsmD family [Atopobium sp. oral taxon 810 str. F0209]
MSGQLRIVGGMWKGKTLETPKGREVTRPSTDRTRERIASMVLSSFALDLSGIHILDAFAGSGALGLELLSRGAASCSFVDINRNSAAVVKRNCAALQAQRMTRVVVGDIWTLIKRGGLWGAPFDLVLLDPPYAIAAGQISQLVEDLDQQGLLAPSARILYEHEVKTSGLTLPKAMLMKSKKQGITTVDLLIYDVGKTSEADDEGRVYERANY